MKRRAVMSKAVIFGAVCATALNCLAFEISFGVSGYCPSLQQELGASSPWFEIVGTCERNQTLTQMGNPPFFFYGLTAMGTGEWEGAACTFAARRLNADSDGVYIGKYSGTAWNKITSAVAEFFGAIVSTDSPTDHYLLGTSGGGASNIVFTISGDPYSRVYNLTGAAQTINGVEIPSGESARLYLPTRLAYWPSYSDASEYYFTDTDGNPIPYINNSTGSSARGYIIGWSGDYVIRKKGTEDPTNIVETTEHLLYADIKAENRYKIMYGKDGGLVREGLQVASTNIQLVTWWDFTQSEWGLPQAVINGTVVCNEHSTDHIISYTLNNNRFVYNEMTGVGMFEFYMSQTPQSGYSGGDCVMRVWDATYGSGKADYGRTPADHKAEVSAGLGVARFKVTINIYAGTWKVEPN